MHKWYKWDGHRGISCEAGIKKAFEAQPLQLILLKIPPKDTSSIVVYVAGNTMTNDLSHGAYWENGLITEIPEGAYSSATCIYVYNNDVYVVAPGALEREAKPLPAFAATSGGGDWRKAIAHEL